LEALPSVSAFCSFPEFLHEMLTHLFGDLARRISFQ
jgi:hypothetical protein